MSKGWQSEKDEIIEGEPQGGSLMVVEDKAQGQSKAPGNFDTITSSVKEVAQKTGEVINKATESIGKAIESALSARDHVVMVRVNDEGLRSIDALVQAGIFKSRSESAAFLISEGVNAQSGLFERIEEKIKEIEKLKSELKLIVETDRNA